MANRIGIMLGGGLDNAGGNTLAVETGNFLQKASQVFYSTNAIYETLKPRKESTWLAYTNHKILLKMLKTQNVTHLFILTAPLKKGKEYKEYLLFLKMLKKLTNIKIIMFNIMRNRTMFTNGWICKETIPYFDKIFTLVGERNTDYKKLKTLVSEIKPTIEVKNIDLNFFDYEKQLYKNQITTETKKLNKISYIGRFANFKGYNYYLNAFIDGKLPKDYIYTCEGGWYTGNNEKFGSTIGVLSVLCDGDLKNKKLKPNLYLHEDYKSYEEIKDKTLMHIFPKYEQEEMVNRLKKTKYVLFPYRLSNRGKFSFTKSLEYTMLECIASGVPAITTKTFGEEFEINGRPLIEQDCGLIFFDGFEEIGKQLKRYEKAYDENVKKMLTFFKENYNNKQKWEIIKKELKGL